MQLVLAPLNYVSLLLYAVNETLNRSFFFHEIVTQAKDIYESVY